jgi:hypothetical protein
MRYFQCYLPATGFLGLAAILVMTAGRTDAQGNSWGNIKGRVVWGGKELPAPAEIKVTVDQGHCLTANPTADKDKGTILDQRFVINKANKGLKNVFVYFLADPGAKIPIHPSHQKFAGEVVLDQPDCMFFPRALAIREGQTFVVKNTAPVQHNIRWIGDPTAGNEGGNVTIKPGDRHEVKDLKAQRLPLSLECNIHGWMKGRLGVFNHPYFTITDENGNFEIKDAPAGMRKLMIYHEEVGYRLGIKGKNGEDVTVKAGGTTDMGQLPMGK